jgi:hypothetical protein
MGSEVRLRMTMTRFVKLQLNHNTETGIIKYMHVKILNCSITIVFHFIATIELRQYNTSTAIK